jgi:hypothetical protein
MALRLYWLGGAVVLEGIGGFDLVTKWSFEDGRWSLMLNFRYILYTDLEVDVIEDDFTVRIINSTSL